MDSVSKTPRLASEEARQKLHQLSSVELDEIWVSALSQFKDNVWRFENLTPGAKLSRSTINWGMLLADGTSFLNDVYRPYVYWSKRLALVLSKAAPESGGLAAGSMGLIQQEIKYFIPWMASKGITNPGGLGWEILQDYVNLLPSVLDDESDEGGVGISRFNRALGLPIRLWEQRFSLAKFDIQMPRSHPYSGQGANTIAEMLATKARGWIHPIPDEVAIPLLNRACWFLGDPARDVIKLLVLVRDPLAGTRIKSKLKESTRWSIAGTGREARLIRVGRYLEQFSFSTIEGEDKPWHKPLDESFGTREQRIVRFRELWTAVRDAASIVVQGCSGMRISELLGITAGVDQATGLPSGVYTEESDTGLYEWFVIQSQLSKGEASPGRQVTWVLGMRPKGSKEIPIAVKALQILNELFEPWRANARTDKLILGPYRSAALPRAQSALVAMPADKILSSMKGFIADWVDISGIPDESARKSRDNDLVAWRESNGRIFTTSMLRKTWANYVLACDARLLPAIQMQFHHLSLATTEGGYIGNNPLLLDALDSVSTQRRNLLLYELVTGGSSFAGRMGQQLESATAELKECIYELPTSEKFSEIAIWADRNQLSMTFSSHATCCPTKVSEMRCHNAVGTPVWMRTGPNASMQEPNVCAGCGSAVMDKSHQPFWSDRYLNMQVSLGQALRRGPTPGGFREIEFRISQARSILRKFGVDISKLDLEVESILSINHA